MLPAPFLEASHLLQRLFHGQLEVVEVDRLGQQVKRPAIHRSSNNVLIRLQFVQRHGPVAGKNELVFLLADLLAKPVADEKSKIWLVIDHQDPGRLGLRSSIGLLHIYLTAGSFSSKCAMISLTTAGTVGFF